MNSLSHLIDKREALGGMSPGNLLLCIGIFGKGGAEVAPTLQTLAHLYEHQHDFKKALSFIEQSCSAYRSTLAEAGYEHTYRWYEAIKAAPETDAALAVLKEEARAARSQEASP